MPYELGSYLSVFPLKCALNGLLPQLVISCPTDLHPGFTQVCRAYF